MHYRRWYTTGSIDDPAPPTPTPDRFWAKVNKTATCWLWVGHVGRHGYGRFWVNGQNVPAHRWSYEQAHGPVPAWPTMHLDHLCRTPACVRPDHLEVVTPRENTLRQPQHLYRTHCVNGHPYEGNRGAGRRCLVCHRERQAVRNAKRRAA